MSLPKLIAPEYSEKLMSLSTPVVYRPYLVSEEKLLLMAKQSQDPKEIRGAVEQIIRNCTFDKINPVTLPSFDLELLLLRLRARSVNNLVEVFYECRNDVSIGLGPETKKCGTHVPVTIDLDKIQLTVPEGHTNKVWLTDTIGITLKYPTLSMLETEQIDADSQLSVLMKCLNTIFTKTGEVYEAQEQTEEELKTFIEGITVPQVGKIRKFFETMPRLEYSFNFECPTCKWQQPIVLTGILDFFD